MKPIPKPVYPCKCCAAVYTWSSDDLFWSESAQDWVCDMCWDDRDIEEEKGVCLADELEKAQAEHDADVINRFIEEVSDKYGYSVEEEWYTQWVVRIDDMKYQAKELHKKYEE